MLGETAQAVKTSLGTAEIIVRHDPPQEGLRQIALQRHKDGRTVGSGQADDARAIRAAAGRPSP